jgi:hypothetical protein
MNAHDESKPFPADDGFMEAAKLIVDSGVMDKAMSSSEELDRLRNELADTKLSLEVANRMLHDIAIERDYAEEQFHAARAEAERLTAIIRSCRVCREQLESAGPPPKI